MALAQCFQDLLCGLSRGTLNALANFVKAAVVPIDAQIAKLTVQLQYLNILAAPVQLYSTAAQAAIAEVRAGANIIPLDAIQSCTPAADLVGGIQANLDAILVSAENVSDDLARMLSFGDELRAELEDLKAIRALYLDILDQIDICVEQNIFEGVNI